MPWLVLVCSCLLASCSSSRECRSCPEPGCPEEDTAGQVDTGPSPDTGGEEDTGTPPIWRVAIYDDTDAVYSSAWAEGLDNIEVAVGDAGLESERITRQQLNEEPGLLHAFDALLFGGGYAYPGYTVHISRAGKARIQEFIQGGGVFVGICAGAWFACDDIDYEGMRYGDESGYDIDLFTGTCEGPVHEVSSYPEWALASVSFPEHEAFAELGDAPSIRSIFYAGGPSFSDLPAGSEAIATYDDPGPHQGTAAVVALPYGGGKVVLWGPHPEVTEVESLPEVSLDPGNHDVYTAIISWAVRGEGS